MQRDCEICESAGSVEFGICQICLLVPRKTIHLRDPMEVSNTVESGISVGHSTRS